MEADGQEGNVHKTSLSTSTAVAAASSTAGLSEDEDVCNDLETAIPTRSAQCREDASAFGGK